MAGETGAFTSFYSSNQLASCDRFSTSVVKQSLDYAALYLAVITLLSRYSRDHFTMQLLCQAKHAMPNVPS
jgi:hypothetical protein